MDYNITKDGKHYRSKSQAIYHTKDQVVYSTRCQRYFTKRPSHQIQKTNFVTMVTNRMYQELIYLMEIKDLIRS